MSLSGGDTQSEASVMAKQSESRFQMDETVYVCVEGKDLYFFDAKGDRLRMGDEGYDYAAGELLQKGREA